MTEELREIKQEKWFYEFELPDGSKTESYLPESVRRIHDTRQAALRHYLSSYGRDWSSALDVSCHEGFFSLVMAEYVDAVVGIDKNLDSLAKARRILNALGQAKVQLAHSSVEDWPDTQGADFVLCFGLLYHVENPIHILRRLASLSRKAVCIETQVLPFQVSGRVEDGNFMWQRDLNGLFGLCVDYSDRKEGGLTDLALVPSRDALAFLLSSFGFREINFYQPRAGDYEQFVRNSRVIVYAEK